MKKIAISVFLAIVIACFNLSSAFAASTQTISVLHADQQKSFAVGEDIFAFRSFTDSANPDTEANLALQKLLC